jgi:putative component of membrane protein insertase Oxa1/YidC/SpoIIIJ protein YidD
MFMSLFHLSSNPFPLLAGSRRRRAAHPLPLGLTSRILPVCGAALLLVSLLSVPTAHGEERLLRGPLKSVRTSTASAASTAGTQGLLEGIASAPILFYQKFLGPSWGQRCAYYPSCSNYALLAIRKHGAVIGSVMTFDRLQHEANEVRYSPLIRAGGEIRVYDPLENNDYWWYTPTD